MGFEICRKQGKIKVNWGEEMKLREFKHRISCFDVMLCYYETKIQKESVVFHTLEFNIYIGIYESQNIKRQ